MRIAKGTRILSSLGSRAILTREGCFEYFPSRRLFPKVIDWSNTIEAGKDVPPFFFSNHHTYIKSLPQTRMQERVFDLEHRLSALYRHSTVAHKLNKIFDHFLLSSRVLFHPSKPLNDKKKKYTCKVWYEQDFYIPGKSIGTFVHYYGNKELQILDTKMKWVHLAPCQDSIYIRGVLTNNLAQYAMIIDRTYTLRLSWNTSKGKKYATILLDAP